MVIGIGRLETWVIHYRIHKINLYVLDILVYLQNMNFQIKHEYIYIYWFWDIYWHFITLKAEIKQR